MRELLSDVLFVSRQSFRSARWSSTYVLVLSAVLAGMPPIQLIATARLIRELGPGATLADVALPLVALTLTVALTAPLQSVRAAIGERSMLRTGADLQSRLARIAADMSPTKLSDARVTAEIEGHSRAIIDAIAFVYIDAVTGLASIVSALAVIIALVQFSPAAAVLVVVAVVPGLIAGRYVSVAVKRMWHILGVIYQRDRYLRETMSRQRSLLELASLGTTSLVAEKVREQQDRVVEARDIPIRATLRAEAIVVVTSTIVLAGAIVSVIVGMNFGAAAAAGVYGVVSAMSAAGQGSTGLAELIQFTPQTTELRGFFERAPQPVTQPSGGSAGQLVVEGLRHRYASSDTYAVDSVDFKVARGEIVALVGVNGAGKTTTINGILGLITPAAGTVTVDGLSRTDVGEQGWLGLFGLLTQEFGRYEFTVRETVSLGSTRNDISDVDLWTALDAAHASAFVRRMPRGLDTQLGEQWGGVGVSGGQWQRLALAWIYLRDAPIWVLDEPTSAIDAETEYQVFHELQLTKDNRITVVVSHRAWTLKGMDRIYVLDAGKILECGTYDELSSAGGRFSEMFAEQQ